MQRNGIECDCARLDVTRAGIARDKFRWFRRRRRPNGTPRDETKTTCSGAVDALGRYSKTSPMMLVCGYPADLSASTAAEAFSLGTEANMPPAV